MTESPPPPSVIHPRMSSKNHQKKRTVLAKFNSNPRMTMGMCHEACRRGLCNKTCKTPNHSTDVSRNLDDPPKNRWSKPKVRWADSVEELAGCRKELNSLGKSRSIEVTIDSGASETVTAESILPEVPTVNPQAPERDNVYVLPDGRLIPNQGEKHVPVVTKEGAHCLMRMQVTSARKSLMSVSRICDAGHRVIFEKNGGFIEHLATGQTTGFHRKGGIYNIVVNLDDSTGFP